MVTYPGARIKKISNYDVQDGNKRKRNNPFMPIVHGKGSNGTKRFKNSDI